MKVSSSHDGSKRTFFDIDNAVATLCSGLMGQSYDKSSRTISGKIKAVVPISVKSAIVYTLSQQNIKSLY